MSAQAHEGSVAYDRKMQPAAVLELPYPPDVVESALNNYLSHKGKSRNGAMRGFTTYRNTQVLATDSANADLFVRVERKSRHEKDRTMVSLLMMPLPGDMQQAGVKYLTMEQSIQYLNELVPTIGSYSLEQQILEQNAVIGKSERAYRDLVEEGAKLERRRVDLDKKIAENKQQQQTQTGVIDGNKAQLANLVGQRKQQ
ncbi:MAG: hypothetical protein EOP50_04505 [Sphingobacteriales bacterium]|nr:MAG: hypothetical protein EOP50_04505 [Sphingobacteriales bacterium]